jgi:hypothetical protein
MTCDSYRVGERRYEFDYIHQDRTDGIINGAAIIGIPYGGYGVGGFTSFGTQVDQARAQDYPLLLSGCL